MRGLEKSVVLVGMMGSGKSAVGRELATALNLPFRDSDAEIETAAGASVQEILAGQGEAAFREQERKIVARLLAEPPHVLATGGGAFMDSQTRARIKERAISVWLKAELPLLLARVAGKKSRPLIEKGDPRETLERLMREREPFYAQADITVASRSGPHDAAVQDIIAALERHVGAA